MRFKICGLTLLAISMLPAVRANIITATLPEFSSGFYPGVPTPGTVGTFTYTIPVGQQITSATISSSFGNSLSSSSSPVDVFVDGILVQQCLSGGVCTQNIGNVPQPWTFTFPSADFPLLATGSATLTFTQTGSAFVRLGDDTLTLNTSSVPEPSALALLLGALALLSFVRLNRLHLRLH
jgi:hypothetical protein